MFRYIAPIVCSVVFSSSLLGINLNKKLSSDYHAFFPNHKGEFQSYLFLLIDKSTLTAELKLWTKDIASSKTLKSFPIALGQVDGDKQKLGDLKTPEGVYFAKKHKDGRYLPAKYGPLAIPLDYPNPIDKLSGKTGSGIWLHGVGPARKVEDQKITRGCVAFRDQDISLIGKWLQPQVVGIVITKDKAQLNQPWDTDQLRAATISWIEAKRLGHPDLLDQLYDPSVVKPFTKDEQLVNNSVDIRTLAHAKYGVSVISYKESPTSQSSLRKILYWKKKENQQRYYLVSEVQDNTPLKPHRFSKRDIEALFGSKSNVHL